MKGLLDRWQAPHGERAFYFRVCFGRRHGGDHVITAPDLNAAFTRIRRAYPSAVIAALDESKTPLARDGLPI